MRILHSKATTDPILLVSACHNMNLFAVVTASTVTVYRSTTLTVVTTLPLGTGYVNQVITSSDELRRAQEAMNGKMVNMETAGGASGPSMNIPPDNMYKPNLALYVTEGMAAWSPSGRLFTFALPCGVVLLLDVESSDLVRILIPKPCPKALPRKRSTDSTPPSSSGIHHGHFNVEGRGRNALPETLRAGDPTTQSFTVFAQVEDGPKELLEGGNPTGEGGLHASSNPAVISLSTTVGPVAALAWVTVPYSQHSPRNLSFYTTGIYSECLPLQPDLSSSLLAEVESSGLQKGDPIACNDAQRAVAILMILDMTGVLSFVLGGLQEVRFMTIRIPHPPGGAICVEKLITVPVWEAQPRWTQPEADLQREEDGRGMETQPARRIAPAAGDSFFFGLTADSLHLLSKQLEPYRGKNRAEEAHKVFERWAHRAVRCSHRAYLVVKPTSTPASDTAGACRELFELDLGFQLTRIVDTRAATICYIAEYCRMAQACMHDQQQLWRDVLENSTRKHLKLPSKAVLLRDTVVERIAQPNQADLLSYYEMIDKFALVEDLEKLSKTLHRVVKAVDQTCYRCYDASISLLNTFYDCNTAMAGHFNDRPPELLGGGGLPTPSPLSMRELSAELMNIIGELRRCAETFLHCVQLGVSYEVDLVHYVLHRSSLLLVPSAASAAKERPNDFSTSPMANSKGKATLANLTVEPLSVERHPTLLRTLERIHRMRSTVFPQYPTACEVDEDFLKWNRRLERLFQCALSRSEGGDGHKAYPHEDPVVAQRMEGIAHDRACGARLVDVSEPRVEGPHKAPTAADSHREETKESPDVKAHLTVKVVEVPRSTPKRAQATCPELYSGELSAIHPSTICRMSSFTPSASAVSLCAPSISLPKLSSATLAPVWYGYLREGRHLCVYLPTDAHGETNRSSPGFSEQEDSSDVLVVAFNDNAGNLVSQEAEEEREGSVQEWEVGESGANQPNESSARVEISGMPISAATIRATMSRAREFFVVAANNRFVVLDLYDD
ncbi:unnamed protein product [Phytomonas sp. EM1]|nr:unnamed protein product [Phytomonas sp. EM1]|eukprot:CCW62530.1 unnamed protein product [Phytomonas sp. isolate EM1]